jgi:ABC-type multidrug transport system permease subunit
MEQENRGKRRKSRPVKPEQAAEERQQAADKRPRGKLRWRWLLNTLGATLVVVAVAVTAFSLAMYSYYTSTILAVNAKRDFWLAEANLAPVIYGGSTGSAAAETEVASAEPAAAGGH